jgi:hypothetical protein
VGIYWYGSVRFIRGAVPVTVFLFEYVELPSLFRAFKAFLTRFSFSYLLLYLSFLLCLSRGWTGSLYQQKLSPSELTDHFFSSFDKVNFIFVLFSTMRLVSPIFLASPPSIPV